MGAVTFQTYGQGDTALQAFTDAVDRAYYEHGHGGYTGTIVEKDGFVEFSLPAGKTLADFDAALDSHFDDDSAPMRKLFGDETTFRLLSAYDSKWGPAVAIKSSDKEWFFCGWASC
jgi:hypothetical protein